MPKLSIYTHDLALPPSSLFPLLFLIDCVVLEIISFFYRAKEEVTKAFEWCNTDKDLILKKNSDLCYFYFESNDPTLKVKLVEAEQTPELIEYRNGISEVPKYVSNSFSLLDIAKSRRPKILLKEKTYE